MIDHPRPDEAAALVALTRATGFFNSIDLRVIREMLDEYLAAPNSSEYWWIVYRDSPDAPPLGFACYGPASLTVGVYDLYWIAVDPRQQGKGLGTKLLEYIEADVQARGGRQLYIETSDTPLYAPTRAFYRQRGYQETAHFEDYYNVGDGKVVFVKRFDRPQA